MRQNQKSKILALVIGLFILAAVIGVVVLFVMNQMNVREDNIKIQPTFTGRPGNSDSAASKSNSQ